MTFFSILLSNAERYLLLIGKLIISFITLLCITFVLTRNMIWMYCHIITSKL